MIKQEKRGWINEKSAYNVVQGNPTDPGEYGECLEEVARHKIP